MPICFRKSKLSHAIASVIASAFFLFLAGLLLWLLSPNPTQDWGFWFGLGIMLYSAIIALYGTLFLIRLFKKAASEVVAIDQLAT